MALKIIYSERHKNYHLTAFSEEENSISNYRLSLEGFQSHKTRIIQKNKSLIKSRQKKNILCPQKLMKIAKQINSIRSRSTLFQTLIKIKTHLLQKAKKNCLFQYKREDLLSKCTSYSRRKLSGVNSIECMGQFYSFQEASSLLFLSIM